jgi:type IV secretory pathway TrbL component
MTNETLETKPQKQPYQQARLILMATAFFFSVWVVIFLLAGYNVTILNLAFWVGLIFGIVRLIQKK